MPGSSELPGIDATLVGSVRTLSDSESFSVNETTRQHPPMSLHLVVLIALLFSAALAASDTCTVFQIHSTVQGIDELVSSDECADYTNNEFSLSVPCDATNCIATVKDVAAKLPDCTLAASDNGGISVNKKTELQKGLSDCSADSSASLSVEVVDTSSAPTTSTARTEDECTIAEASTTASLYLKTARSSACDPYVMMDDSTMTVYIYAPCAATDCVAVMEMMVKQLPDCYTSGVNLRDDVLESLASCTDSSDVDPFSKGSSSDGNECSSDQVSSLAVLINSIVTSSECESHVAVTATEWNIAIPCNATTCLATLDEAVDQMPDCEFEGTNYKDELRNQQQLCVDSVDNGSTNEVNNLRTTAPASDESVNSTESSVSTLCSAKFGAITLGLMLLVLV